ASVLPKEIIEQNLQERKRNLKNLRLYGTIVGELTAERRRKYQVRFEEIGNITVDVLAGNLKYEKQATPNREELVTESSLTLPAYEDISYSSDDSENDLEENNDRNDMDVIDLIVTVNWREQQITIDQRAIYLAYNQDCKINIPSVSLASPYELFRRYLPLDYIEQFVINSINKRERVTSNWTNITINEYMRWLGLWVLMSVFLVADRRFYWRTNQEQTQPIPLFNFQHWMSRSRFEQIVWPLNYPHDMIQKLENTYGSYFSKVAIVNGVYLIAASLKDRKPQCIIATASTTTQGDEVERIVKDHNNSSLVKFIRSKIFSEYSSSK
ncbi:9176_t:CDS:2, partial [Racocetra fulgida]